MIDTEVKHHSEEIQAPGRYFVPSLAIASFTMSPPMFILAIFLDDIGKTFDQPSGGAGQLETISLIVAAITALLMGAWSIRFNHKSLLVVGLALLNLSAVGCFFAFNFFMMILAYALTGLGYTMIQPMTYTLVGKYLPPEKRSSAIGWLSAGMASAYLVGSLVIVFLVMAGWGGWRSPFLIFALPASLIGLIMVFRMIKGGS